MLEIPGKYKLSYILSAALIVYLTTILPGNFRVPLIYIGAVLLPTTLFVYIYLNEKRKGAAMADLYDKFANQIAFKKLRKKDMMTHIDRSRFFFLAPRLIGTCYITDIFSGHYRGYDVCFFNIKKSDFDSRTAVKQTAVHLKAPLLDMPDFILAPRGEKGGSIGRMIYGIGKEVRLQLNDGFSRKYYLADTNEARLKKLFQPEVMDYFEKNEGFNIEGHGNGVLLFRNGDMAQPSQILEYIDRAILILKLFKIEQAEK